ncbi:MaoC family dehydratase [Chondromyces apiculatus]|uniref:Mesaconyl-CoA hydratase n=1 Tax=Chondromyces apiculatus DSM 436 TaxID=1192034 RepID=A0A017T929_9BACT|nr:MaoC family dehydratase [Chondromyces apiculatus]EYF05778.1 Mesaconyl-CoA hydratase [Chondromyces apiculatus DSM 436]
MLRSYRYGRRLDDFDVDAIYAHPWDVTVDEGTLALFSASFQDALPVYASREAARAVGLRDRPVHPLLLLNLGLSFSVHDVSEQAIAHLAYIDVRFPNACYPGDTLRASSRVIGKKPVSQGDKGVVHVRTHVVNQDDVLVCSFERKALVRTGRVEERPPDPPHDVTQRDDDPGRRPPEIALAAPSPTRPPTRRGGFATFWEDLAVDDVYAHDTGRTVSEAEHMTLSTLTRNSHPLHFDERYCQQSSFARTRVVHGGLVLSWVLALSSRDTAGNGVWDLGLDDGVHSSGVLAGDTLFAATKVLAREEVGPLLGSVTLRVVGVKNTHPRALIEQGADLFTPELGKTEGKVKEKVVEISRTLLVRRRVPATSTP